MHGPLLLFGPEGRGINRRRRPKILPVALRLVWLAVLLVFPGGILLHFSPPVFSKETSKTGKSPLIRVKQGEVVFFTLAAHPDTVSVNGIYLKRTVPFFPTQIPNEFGALIGIDLADPASRAELVATLTRASGASEKRRYPIVIVPVKFSTEKLEVPQNFVDLDEETARRVEQEQEKILSSLRTMTGERLWRGPFLLPVEGKVKGSFGLRRIMNGQPRSPHSGEDISAPAGTPVRATNEGIVALVGDYFFSGKSIVVDHGLGLFTMYFHLDEIAVAEGDKIQKGQVIGKVGATGRATGPHLHWGLRINGARINPMSILSIP